MPLHLFNTLTREKEKFEPFDWKKVRMYNCGPTVYDYAHIGNLTAFLLADILRRYMEDQKYRVVQVMNITDVGHLTEDDIGEGEDKMAVAVKRVKETEGRDITAEDVARFYEAAFFEDMDALGIKRAHEYPRATDHVVSLMIPMIEDLIHKYHAYVTEAGNVYFDVKSHPAYGKLSGNTLEDLQAGARCSVREEKRHPADFALWKTDPGHLMTWPSPWGEGFPGWHIECTAMGMHFLGETFDIHTGGEDNIFPHHECEIAQAYGATGQPLAKYWVHQRHLMVDGKKMSKSAGNMYTLRDLTEKGYSGREVRYSLIQAHYRTQANFSLEGLNASRAALERIDDFIACVSKPSEGPSNAALPGRIETARKEFELAMDDDLNVSGGLAAIFGFITDVNKLDLGAGDGDLVLERMKTWDDVLGVLTPEAVKTDVDTAWIDQKIQERNEARENKDFEAADRIRDELLEKGIALKDCADGTEWKPVKS